MWTVVRQVCFREKVTLLSGSLPSKKKGFFSHFTLSLSRPPERYTKTRGRPSWQQLWERALQDHILTPLQLGEAAALGAVACLSKHRRQHGWTCPRPHGGDDQRLGVRMARPTACA